MSEQATTPGEALTREEAPAVIKGDGFNSAGGGFATLIVDGKRYSADAVGDALSRLNPTPAREGGLDREAVARELCHCDEQDGGPPWDWYANRANSKEGHDGYYRRADTVLALTPDQSARVLELKGEVERLEMVKREAVQAALELQAKVAELSAENERLKEELTHVAHPETGVLAMEVQERLAAESALQAVQATIAGMREALGKTREQFKLYVDQHLAKTPPDYAKAETNREMVRLIDAAQREGS